MKRAMYAAAVVLTGGLAALAWRYRCLGKHDPEPVALGLGTLVSRCRRCGRPLVDLEDAGLMDGEAYVDLAALRKAGM